MHQVGDLFELNVKLRCQKLKIQITSVTTTYCQGTIRNPDLAHVEQKPLHRLGGILTPPRYTAGDTLPAFSWKTKLRVGLSKNMGSFFGKSQVFSYYQERQYLGIYPAFSAVGFVTSCPVGGKEEVK